MLCGADFWNHSSDQLVVRNPIAGNVEMSWNSIMQGYVASWFQELIGKAIALLPKEIPNPLRYFNIYVPGAPKNFAPGIMGRLANMPKFLFRVLQDRRGRTEIKTIECFAT